MRKQLISHFTVLFIIPHTILLSSIQPEAETLDFSTTHFREIFRKSSHHLNTNKGDVVKQSGNDVEGGRSQKVLFQPNMRLFLQYSVNLTNNFPLFCLYDNGSVYIQKHTMYQNDYSYVSIVYIIKENLKICSCSNSVSMDLYGQLIYSNWYGTAFLQSDWLIASLSNTIRTTFFNFCRKSGIFQVSVVLVSEILKILSCLIFGHFNTGQTICKHKNYVPKQCVSLKRKTFLFKKWWCH